VLFGSGIIAAVVALTIALKRRQTPQVAADRQSARTHSRAS
jgi:hypothetical protein